jgi:hypothetical protein
MFCPLATDKLRNPGGEVGTIPDPQKKPDHLGRQPGYLNQLETRGFPSPTHAGFGFIYGT